MIPKSHIQYASQYVHFETLQGTKSNSETDETSADASIPSENAANGTNR
jgi:hypothetical protein